MAVGSALTDSFRWQERTKADLDRKSLEMALRQNVKVCTFQGFKPGRRLVTAVREKLKLKCTPTGVGAHWFCGGQVQCPLCSSGL